MTRASLGFVAAFFLCFGLGVVVVVGRPATCLLLRNDPPFHATITSAVTSAIPSSVATRTLPWTRSLTPRLRRAPRADRLHLDRRDVARVELVHVDLAVEAEVLRVRAEEAFDVRVAREQVEPLVLDRLQVLAADLGAALDLREVEALAEARLAQAGADLEHGASVDPLSRKSLFSSSYTPTDERRSEREVDPERAEEAPHARDAAPSDAADRALRAPARRAGEHHGDHAEHERRDRGPAASSSSTSR